MGGHTRERRNLSVRQVARSAFVVVAWVFVVCAVVQVFLAGLGVFAGPQNFLIHREFGYLFGLLTIVLIVLALVGRLPRRLFGLSVLLLLMFALQSVFIVAWRSGASAVAALHPVNGFLILLLGIVLAREARAFAATPIGTARPNTGANATAESQLPATAGDR